MRTNFLKDTNEVKEKQIKSDRKYEKVQEKNLEVMKKGFETMTAGINHLINNSKKTNNDSMDTNTVKALELRATNERIDKLEETVKSLLDKVEEQNIKIIKLEESKKVSKELFPESEKPGTTKVKPNIGKIFQLLK